MKRLHYLAAIAAVSATAVGTAAYAMENDAMAIIHAKIPLTQAITTAEQHVQGKASKAEYEKTAAGWAYDVEVVQQNKVFDVKVDANSGMVIASNEDQADRDHDQDKKD